MANDEIKAGSVVTLKTGSPEMTVESINEISDGNAIRTAKCTYWSGEHQKFETLKIAIDGLKFEK